MKRGNCAEYEVSHGKHLLQDNIGKIWGWETPAGMLRVKRRVEWFLSCMQKLPQNKNINLLECGCGTGIFTRALLNHIQGRDVTITALDISADLLCEARKRCNASNIRFIEGNLEDLSNLEDNYFDMVYGVSVLHHVDVDIVIQKLKRKVRKNAIFAFSEPNILNPLNKYYYYVQDQEKRKQRGTSPTEMAFTKQELLSYFEKSGCHVSECFYRDFMHPSTPAKLTGLMAHCERVAEATPLLQTISGSLWISGIIPDN